MTTTYSIPFNQPSIEGKELIYVARAVERGQISCKGPFSEQVSSLLTDALHVNDVLLTTSCTAALEMAAMMLEFEPDDVVIIPSFTFVSTALAFARAGARIRFADIERETLGIDPKSVAELLTPEVKAVVPVHYAGIGCDMDGLERELAPTPVSIVEDNAHGLFGAIDGRPLGSFGRFSCLSFHETKNFVCGEGGALALSDPADVERAHVLYDKGTNRRAYFAGQVDKYSWVDTGSSFGMSDLLAGYLLAQLEARDSILDKRRRLTERYTELLGEEGPRLGFDIMRQPSNRTSAYHMFYVLLDTRERRDAVLAQMNAEGIRATFHYVPLHSSLGAKGFLDYETECPVADEISGRLLRLPFFNDLRLDQVGVIVDSFLRAVS